MDTGKLFALLAEKATTTKENTLNSTLIKGI